jgi:hypothetical protein
LERLGWTFVRIRGSLFFRDEDRALAAVFKRLEELGVPPELKTLSKEDAESRNELSDRVIRVAERLRIEWRTNGGGEAEANDKAQAPREAKPPPRAPEPLPRTALGTNTLGRFEHEIISALRVGQRQETEPLLLGIARRLGLDYAGRRELRMSLDMLERRGVVRTGVNYVVLCKP